MMKKKKKKNKKNNKKKKMRKRPPGYPSKLHPVSVSVFSQLLTHHSTEHSRPLHRQAYTPRHTLCHVYATQAITTTYYYYWQERVYL